MNKSRLFKGLLLLLCVIGTAAYGQKETKVYKEVFQVTPETVLDINTSSTDIQFETWNKNQIEIEATIELEGATAQEAQDYFENDAIEIVGNSKIVTIKTIVKNKGLSNKISWPDMSRYDNGLDIQMEALNDQMSILNSDSLLVNLSIINDMPPMPPVPPTNFDYKAFEKDGEKYLKKWQSEFKEGFGKEYQEKMQAWQQQVAQRQEKMSIKRSEMLQERAEQRSERFQERAEQRAERMQKLAEQRAERMIAFQERKANFLDRRKNRYPGTKLRKDSLVSTFFSGDSVFFNRPKTFYFSSDGKNKNYKIKKTLKIKMPKNTKIKMNVRHGEVKLAANTMNIDADLSYANLSASKIDGAATIVKASYSPIFVEKWNLGQLQTEYSESVNLQEVGDLRLTATSSDVTIGRLLNSAIIKNEYGPLRILSVAIDFSDLDISLQNAEFDCELPDTPFNLYVNGTSSELTLPAKLQLERTKNGTTTILKGFYKNKNSGSGIVVNSRYSEVVFN